MGYNKTINYYFQKPSNFYQRDDIRKLERTENGYELITIYEKLLIDTLNKEGKLVQIFGNREEEYSIDDLAIIFNHDRNTVEIAINTFIELGMIERQDNILFFPDSSHYTRSSTVGANKKRMYREEKNKEVKVDICPPLVSNSGLTKLKLEKEQELEIENNKNIIRNKKEIEYKEIIDYLNLKSNFNYRHTTPKTKELIKTRYDEGFTLIDFKIVIDNKTNEWIGTEYEKYLRPNTLFGTKFESYLNQKSANKIRTLKDISMNEIEEAIKLERNKAYV